MNPTRRRLLGALAGTAVLAGCLDEGDDEARTDATGDEPADDTTADEPTDDEPAAEATIQVGDNPEYGPLLVDAGGMTLYMFDSDDRDAGESTCYDDCVENWPPLTVPEGEPRVGDGVGAAVSTFEREDGENQVAADGWPLYYWQADDQSGDATGQGVDDIWWVLDPGGEPVRDDADIGTGY